jgi:glycosyltransferase involved in cell wall biosynthesis
LATSLGVSEHVKFLGHLSDRESVFAHLLACDVFVMPTLRDGPPVVFLEAMAVGKPVICLDLGGAAEIVTSETGIKVPAVSPTQVVRDLAAAMKRLVQDPALRSRLGGAGRHRLQEHFDWDKKGLLIAELYKSLSIAEDRVAVECPPSA